MLGSIKLKMFVLIVVSLGLGAFAVTTRFERVYEENLGLHSTEAIQNAAASFDDLQRTNTNLMAAALTVFLQNPELAPAVAARDHDRLVALSTPTFKDFKIRYGLTNWNWWALQPVDEKAPTGLVNIARVQQPPKYGDFVERVATRRIAAERALVTGLDLGFTGLALRALLPVREGEDVVGYVEWGMEIRTFLETMKNLSGNEFGLVVEKSAMNHEQWSATRTHLGERDNWDDMPTLLLVQNTSGDAGMFQHGGTIADLPDKGKPLGILKKGDRIYLRGAFPIPDMSGRKIGAVFVLKDVTSLANQLNASRRNAVLLMAGLMLVLAAVLIGVFQYLVVRRLDRMTAVATRVVGGEFDLKVVPAAKDEIGAFETLFEQFRTLFVELLAKAEEGEAARKASGEVRR